MHCNKLSTLLTSTLLLASQTSAHFRLQYPNPLGFEEDKEATGPCGGFEITFDNATDFHVEGDAVAVTSTHPEAIWNFRATLDRTAMGNNWTDIIPPVSQEGLGQYCEPSLTVPTNWAGQSGVVQVIQHGDDGFLYQCAAVNYVAGRATETPSSCSNATGLTAEFDTDPSAAASAVPSSSMTDSMPSGMSGSPPGETSAASSGAVSKNQLADISPLVLSIISASGLTAFLLGLSCM